MSKKKRNPNAFKLDPTDDFLRRSRIQASPVHMAYENGMDQEARHLTPRHQLAVLGGKRYRERMRHT